METRAATIKMTPTECPQTARSGVAVSQQRRLSADHDIVLTSDLPDAIPVTAEELELMHRYFDDLIRAAFAGDA
jgi:hypothetical protein